MERDRAVVEDTEHPDFSYYIGNNGLSLFSEWDHPLETCRFILHRHSQLIDM